MSDRHMTGGHISDRQVWVSEIVLTEQELAMSDERIWTAEIVFTEDADRTRADVLLLADGRELQGWGRAKRNPTDPDIPAVGEELAAARALSDLAHQLIQLAAEVVEGFEGHPVHLHG